MKEKIIFCYDPETLEYIGEGIARQSPMDKEGVYLIPAFATDIKPDLESGKISRFINSCWVNQLPISEEIPKTSLEEKKQEIISILKANRCQALSRLTYFMNIGENYHEFYLRIYDLPIIQAIISSLSDSDTRSWTDKNGKRINLNKSTFELLLAEIVNNDRNIYDLYSKKMEEINKCLDTKELELINLNCF